MRISFSPPPIAVSHPGHYSRRRAQGEDRLLWNTMAIKDWHQLEFSLWASFCLCLRTHHKSKWDSFVLSHSQPRVFNLHLPSSSWVTSGIQNCKNILIHKVHKEIWLNNNIQERILFCEMSHQLNSTIHFFLVSDFPKCLICPDYHVLQQ